MCQILLQSVECCGLQRSHKIAIHIVYTIYINFWRRVVMVSRGHAQRNNDEIFWKSHHESERNKYYFFEINLKIMLKNYFFFHFISPKKRKKINIFEWICPPCVSSKINTETYLHLNVNLLDLKIYCFFKLKSIPTFVKYFKDNYCLFWFIDKFVR